MEATQTIFSYAAPEPRQRTRLAAPTITFLSQFLWLAAFGFASFFRAGPKQPFWDSLIYLVMIIPSAVSVFVTLRSFGWHYHRNLNAGASLMVLYFLMSTGVVFWITFFWVVDLLLDPHGYWHV